MPYIFERELDLEGRLRLPDFLYDDYETCYLSLGLFSDVYLQITPDGVYELIDKSITGDFKDRQAFDFQRRFHTGESLVMDRLGRIQIPDRLLRRANILPGTAVVGQAGPRNNKWKEGSEPAYWTLEDKQRWVRENPGGIYALDLL